MTPNPVSISAGMPLKDAAAFLADRGIGAVPVIDEAGRPVGVLRRSDIVGHDREGSPFANPEYYGKGDLSPGPARLIWTDVEDGDLTPVSDVMTPVVLSAAPETPAHKVIEEMLGRKVHRLFVVSGDGVLIGVISIMDVLGHLSPEEPVANTGQRSGAGQADGLRAEPLHRRAEEALVRQR
jgi:CBS domain-containing protein